MPYIIWFFANLSSVSKNFFKRAKEEIKLFVTGVFLIQKHGFI